MKRSTIIPLVTTRVNAGTHETKCHPFMPYFIERLQTDACVSSMVMGKKEDKKGEEIGR